MRRWRCKIVGNIVDGGKSGWDEIAIVHYASIKHFCDMLAGEDYQAMSMRSLDWCPKKISLNDLPICV